MTKNIVVFSDGTGQEGGKGSNTNVYKTFNLILDRSPLQVSFYDKGLGTGWRKVTGNILGRGFSTNVLQCYRFIFDNYEAGDEIFLFGFSRGAATVRSLTGFIDLFGILPRSRGKLINEAWKIYKMSNKAKRKEKADEFLDKNHNIWASIKFVGVWDTVAALGIPETGFDKVLNWILPHEFHDFRLSESVQNAAHAVAIDDLRKAFHPVFFNPKLPEPKPGKKKQTLEQVFFMGMHTDVGGGYPEKELSDIVLEWMMQHALKNGLHFFFDKRKKKSEWPDKFLCKPNPNGPMHDSRDKGWKKIAFKKKQRIWFEDYGKPVIHESVALRTKGVDNESDGYLPWILEHDPVAQPWAHMEDWKKEPWFENVAEKDWKALEDWFVPTRPSLAEAEKIYEAALEAKPNSAYLKDLLAHTRQKMAAGG